MQKLINRDALKNKLASFNNLKIGFTSGSFDIIHSTHIELLRMAKEKCDILIVGLNTDNSIRRYKDKNRPINLENDRIETLAAIEYIDYIFLFDETDNKKNINELKPDLYFKGADYDKSRLTSAPLIESYGGEVVILPTSLRISSTKIIQKIITSEITVKCSESNIFDGIVMIDRDGVVNHERDYLYKTQDFELLPRVTEAIIALNNANLAVVIITNQPGIGVNLFSEEDFFQVNRKMIQEMHKNKARIDKVYFCPDIYPSKYKKPNIGMLNKIISDIKTNSDSLFVIGDRRSDIKAGNDVGAVSIGVLTGKRLQDHWVDQEPDYICTDLMEAIKVVLCKH